MNDEINRKRFFRRFEFWLIVVSSIVAVVLAALGGCARYDDSGARPGSPEPSPVLRSFPVGTRAQVIEFRDSAGRVCVLAVYPSHGVALDCARPLPPLEYEQLLPEPAVTPIPATGGLEKRPH